MIDEIKTLCIQLAVKKDFVEHLVEEIYKAFGIRMSAKSIHNNWLSGYWSIPVKFQELVKDSLVAWIENKKITA